MRRRRVELARDLRRHHAVAVHDVARDVAIAGIRGVRDHCPTLRGGGRGGVAHGVVVGALDLAHLGAVARDRVAAGSAHVLVHEDHAAAAEQVRAPATDRPWLPSVAQVTVTSRTIAASSPERSCCEVTFARPVEALPAGNTLATA